MDIFFNVNSYVRVRLTDRGRAILAMKNECPPKEDSDGWSRWQLWCLMSSLGGDQLSIGFTPPFQPGIILEAP